MELIELKKPMIHTISIKRKIFLQLAENEELNYLDYLKRINNLRFRDLNTFSKVMYILQFLAVGFFGLFFFYLFIESLPSFFELVVADFIDLYNQNSNLPDITERMIFRIIFAIGMVFAFLILSFLFLIFYRAFKYCFCSLFKPLSFRNEEKALMENLDPYQSNQKINPIITEKFRLYKTIKEYQFVFNYYNTEQNLEEYILSLKRSISLTGINITIGCWIFFLFSIPFALDNFEEFGLLTNLIFIVGLGIATIGFTFFEIYLPILSILKYYNMKKLSLKNVSNQINIAYANLLDDNIDIQSSLRIIILKDHLNNLEKLPLIPISRIIKFWVTIGILLPFLSFLFQL